MSQSLDVVETFKTNLFSVDSQVCPKEQCECDVKLANCLKGMKTPTVRPKCPDYFRAPKAGSSGSSWLTY
ncbi:hypothetical protein RvY_15905 [Ramazzottius varieornatus]|uniref:Uncharacterized protein n=1 Tax=Ramazzottius varieornatus TaxID=947166 RepID=A0A1D1W380_RAMVA|nr:hypothetical protein RvY_15905 [Ramazzottius varieornatus]